MCKKLQKLIGLLDKQGIDTTEMNQVAMYMAIVFLAMKIPVVANEFRTSEQKVENALCRYGVLLKKDKSFHNNMHQVAKAYSENQTELQFKAA